MYARELFNYSDHFFYFFYFCVMDIISTYYCMEVIKKIWLEYHALHFEDKKVVSISPRHELKPRTIDLHIALQSTYILGMSNGPTDRVAAYLVRVNHFILFFHLG